jgi:sortase A
VAAQEDAVSQTAVRVEETDPGTEPAIVGGRGNRHGVSPPRRAFPRMDPRAIVSRSVTALGILALLFVGYELFGTSIGEARSQTKLLSAFQTQLKTNPSAVPALGDPVALLEIPRFPSQDVVVQGVRSTDLQKGPGHDPGSPMPGQVGDAVIMGHRTTYGGPFRHISELARGDSITVFTAEGRFQYTVLDVRVTSGTPLIATSTEVGYLTLITSDPTFGGNRQVQVLAQLVTQPLTPISEIQMAVGAVRNGSGADRMAYAPVLLWGELFAAVLVIAWVLYRRWSPWATHLITSPILIALMFLLFSSIDRLLPRTL